MGKPGDKALFLIGHDTNLTNMAGSLNLNWLLDGRRDDTPPGSTMVFELWRTHVSTACVFFTPQTLEQMRNTTPLTGDAKPPRVPLPGCSNVNNACTWSVLNSHIKNITGKDELQR
jgi:4-phytase/acid phosphatase